MLTAPQRAEKSRLPLWIRVRRGGGVSYLKTTKVLRSLQLHTVCEEAKCPNIGECFSHKTATFMLLGDTCTRGCRYCAVAKGKPAAVDKDEPMHIAEAVSELSLRHVVLTSVDRDDLIDGGSRHFAETVHAIKLREAGTSIEVLIPDFRGRRDLLEIVLDSPVDILNHNIETVPRLFPEIRGGGRYEWSLDILRWAAGANRKIRTKSGLMLGLGETYNEVIHTLNDLRAAHCEVLTLGQYLQPEKTSRPVSRFVTPDEFDQLREEALGMGFAHVESGPLVRSSYHAWSYAR